MGDGPRSRGNLSAALRRCRVRNISTTDEAHRADLSPNSCAATRTIRFSGTASASPRRREASVNRRSGTRPRCDTSDVWGGGICRAQRNSVLARSASRRRTSPVVRPRRNYLGRRCGTQLVRAGTVEWSCLRTADHAVDCVWAPALFLASRRQDRYPELGAQMMLGPNAEPSRLIESLETATRVLSAVINDAAPERARVIFRRPEVLVAAPKDFAPRGAMELCFIRTTWLRALACPSSPTPRCVVVSASTRGPGRCGQWPGTVSLKPTTPGAIF